MALDRGDVAGAFAYAERRRNDVMRTAPEVASAAEIARRLANSDTAVLELVALPDELVAFCVTASGLTATRTHLARADLDQLVRSNASERLYDLLVRPSDASLRAARKVIIVADRRLVAVPFAALVDARTRQFLIDRFAVALAESASALQASALLGPSPSILAVALAPADAAALPQSVAEVSDLHRLDRTAAVLGAETTYRAFADAARSAQVLHVGGHTRLVKCRLFSGTQ